MQADAGLMFANRAADGGAPIAHAALLRQQVAEQIATRRASDRDRRSSGRPQNWR